MNNEPNMPYINSSNYEINKILDNLNHNNKEIENKVGDLIRSLWDENHNLKNALNELYNFLSNYLDVLEDSNKELDNSHKTKETIQKIDNIIDKIKSNKEIKDFNIELIKTIRCGMSNKVFNNGLGTIIKPNLFMIEKDDELSFYSFPTPDRKIIRVVINEKDLLLINLSIAEEHEHISNQYSVRSINQENDREEFDSVIKYIKEIMESENNQNLQEFS